jgi:hypothetical protein
MHKKKDTKEMLASKQEYEYYCSRYNIKNLKISVLTMACNPDTPSKGLLINNIKILQCWQPLAEWHC